MNSKTTNYQSRTQIASLLEQGKQNALIYLERNRAGQQLSLLDENNLFLCLKDIQTKLNLEKIPRRIECYDISHISGKFVYGSMVTFIDGQPAKKFYKLFKTKDQNDDFANHREVLLRRLKRYFDNVAMVSTNQQLSNQKFQIESDLSAAHPWALPDLLIVDGGKGQLSSDLSILRQFGLEERVPVCGLAKRIEEIFLPEQAEPILFKGQTLFLLQRIRDEAHRFAITANRQARLKTASISELDEISGLGLKTKQKLLRTFGSVKNLVENLEKNPMLVHEAVGEKITQKLREKFSF
jgi:excinuclease ABC subunit C